MSELTDFEQLREKPSLFVSEIIGLEPFDYQKNFLDNSSRNKVICSGRQVGKSRMCSWIALWKAITDAYTQVLITAPSLRQSSLLFSTLVSEIDKSGLSDEQWGITRDTQTILEFDNGSSIHCLPTGRNGNKIRGFTADMIIVDEAAFIEEKIFEDILEPMTFATQGNMVLASTPWGKSGYFYRSFQKADSTKKWGRVQVSSYDNPIIDDDDLDEFKDGKTSAQIKREVYGKFVDDSGQFFPSDAIRDCMPGGRPERKGDHAYLGLDVSGDGEDRTVFYGVDDQGNVFLHDEEYDDMGVLKAAEYAKTLDNNFGFDRVYVDRTAIGKGTLETLVQDPTISRKIEPVYFSVQKKQQIYQRLKAAMEAEHLHLPHDKTLRSELESIGSEQTQAGNLKLHARGGENSSHDDHVDALALAVWGLPEFGKDAQRGQGSKSPTFGSANTTARQANRPSRKAHRQRVEQANERSRQNHRR